MRLFRRSFRCTFVVVLCLPLTLLLAATAQAAVHEKVLYRFTGGTDGAYPDSSLLLDRHGNLYGTTSGGGDQNCSIYGNPGCGVVFELTPFGKGKWQQQVIYTFQGGADGLWPSGNLVLDASGNLYGTTLYGGDYTRCTDYGCGTVFELSPNADGTWTKSVLYDFSASTDGIFPSGLLFDKAGNLYGITYEVYGTIYELSPPKQKGGAWTETILYTLQSFGGQPDPYLVFDSKGNLFGAWFNAYGGEWGAAYELEWTGKTWQETDLYDFLGGGYGGQPKGGVTLGGKGHVYGTGASGGNDFGIAFELKQCSGQWKESMIYNFCSLNGCADGADPEAPLLLDQSGAALYGTTAIGGTGCTFPGCGVVFKLAHTKMGWQETVVHSFKGPPDGSYPGALTPDGKGNLYGSTVAGGTGNSGYGYGTVFEVTLQSKKVQAPFE